MLVQLHNVSRLNVCAQRPTADVTGGAEARQGPRWPIAARTIDAPLDASERFGPNADRCLNVGASREHTEQRSRLTSWGDVPARHDFLKHDEARKILLRDLRLLVASREPVCEPHQYIRAHFFDF